MDIANHLRHLLDQKEWVLRDLSNQTGLSVSYLSDIQRGRTMPTLETIEKIAAAFEISVVVFLGGADMELSNDEKWLIECYRAYNTTEVLRLLVHHQDGIREHIVNESGDITEIPF